MAVSVDGIDDFDPVSVFVLDVGGQSKLPIVLHVDVRDGMLADNVAQGGGFVAEMVVCVEPFNDNLSDAGFVELSV